LRIINGWGNESKSVVGIPNKKPLLEFRLYRSVDVGSGRGVGSDDIVSGGVARTGDILSGGDRRNVATFQRPALRLSLSRSSTYLFGRSPSLSLFLILEQTERRQR